ncbi:MAG: Cysteine desulfurase (EC [uncultured Aureispira sp.]|uniref:Cysteine desulfurase (EC) n=1 Tax=uncultured Aureispira sp. TaxID=1331704 RepID=A0A6S6T7R4_9BACT|nr:MAG: Cysteine desulfurase (EC [uncultured Aureispira sp.]
MRIYLDNAASTPLSDNVLEAMLPYLKNNYGNPSSAHQEGRTARAAIEKARKVVANAVKASSFEIFFTSGGTEANNTAIKCAVRDLGVQRIISSSVEHSCVLNTAHRMEAEQVEIVFVELEATGRANLDHLEHLLNDRSKKTLVSLMHANNEVGTLNPIDKIGALCKQYNAYFHTDTVQSVGHIPIDVSKLNISFLSGSAHKLHGPKGVGFLYVNKDNLIEAYIDGGGQERNLRSGTENVAGIIGLGKALELATTHLEEHRIKIEGIRTYFIQELQANFPDLLINGDYSGAYLFTILSVAFKSNLPVNMLLFKLDLKGISASGGSACHSGSVSKSRVIKTLGTPDGYHTLRFSFSHLNKKEEIDHVIAQLKEII